MIDLGIKNKSIIGARRKTDINGRHIDKVFGFKKLE